MFSPSSSGGSRSWFWGGVALLLLHAAVDLADGGKGTFKKGTWLHPGNDHAHERQVRQTNTFLEFLVPCRL